MGKLLYPSPSYIERITVESSHFIFAKVWPLAIVKSRHKYRIIHADMRQYDECMLRRNHRMQ